MQQPTLKLLARIGSLKLTAAGIGLLIAGVLTAHLTKSAAVWWLVSPLLLLAVNLAAAIAINPRLNRRTGLLVFHVGLFAVIVLVAYGRLIGFHGRVELVQGQAFSAEGVDVRRSGPLHDGSGLNSVRFLQGSIRVDYAPDIIRQQTVSLIHPENTGAVARVGDNAAYESEGYTFHTTANKGFAAIVAWQATGGNAEAGAIHFPSYPLNEWRQDARWQPAGEATLEMSLTGLDRLDDRHPFILDARAAEGVGLEVAGQVLAEGETLVLPGGRLELVEVTMWMGYEIRSEPLTLWTFLAAVIGVCGIGWHFLSAPTRSVPRSDPAAIADASMPRIQHG